LGGKKAQPLINLCAEGEGSAVSMKINHHIGAKLYAHSNIFQNENNITNDVMKF
jgi:hypothetical protein